MSLQIAQPYGVDEVEGLCHQCPHGSPPIRSTQVLYQALTCRCSLHVLILSLKNYMHGYMYVYLNMNINSYPVHYCQVHSHHECSGSEMDSFGKVGEESMVERLDPVCVTAL